MARRSCMFSQPAIAKAAIAEAFVEGNPRLDVPDLVRGLTNILGPSDLVRQEFNRYNAEQHSCKAGVPSVELPLLHIQP